MKAARKKPLYAVLAALLAGAAVLGVVDYVRTKKLLDLPQPGAALGGPGANRPPVRPAPGPGDPHPGQQLSALDLPRATRCVALRPDGEQVAVGTEGGDVQVWDVGRKRRLRTFDGQGPVAAVAFSPDGRSVASAGDDGAAVWWAAAGQELRALTLVGSPGPALAAPARLWAPSAGRLRTLHGHARRLGCVAFAPDGTRLATGSVDRTARVWDVRTGAEVCVLRGHGDDVVTVAFSPDGRRLATASRDRTVRVWDASTGALLGSSPRQEHFPGAPAFGPDSRLAWGDSGGSVRLWNPAAPDWVVGHTLHADAVLAVAFSADGRRLLSAGRDGRVVVWDPAAPRAYPLITGARGDPDGAALSADGWKIATWDRKSLKLFSTGRSW